MQEGKVTITNGFRKKQQKLPPTEKERALVYKENYQKRMKEGTKEFLFHKNFEYISNKL